MNSAISINREQIASFCEKNHIRRLALFGSGLRNDFNTESDIDLLVEFEKGFTPGENDLSKLIGRKVDLNTSGFLSRYIRDRIINEAEVLYAES